MTKIDSKIPEGPVAEKWTNYKACDGQYACRSCG